MSTFPPQPSASFPYEIEQKVGEGAMGVVYRAIEPELRRRVAVKFLRPKAIDDADPSLAQELRRRFMQEARAAAALSHPGVTTIYRVGEADGWPFIAMEWLDGRPLDEVLAAEGRLAPGRAARIGVELLEALDAAHRAGVVHRDVKPANLVLLASDRLKVTDFGIAFVTDSDLVKTQTGLILATPQFASPEQFAGTDIDGRCDVWAVGVLLYLALSGRYPFEGRSIVQLVNSVARQVPDPLERLVKGLPPDYAAIVHKALEKVRSRRFDSAGEMAAALRRFSGLSQSLVATSALEADDETPTMIGVSAYGTTVGAAPAAVESSPGASPEALETRVARPAAAGYPKITGLPRHPRLAVVEVVRGWPAKPLGRTASAPLVDRVLDRPLHAEPFAGALEIDGRLLLVSGGFVVGAVGPDPDASCDAVCEGLPDVGEATLHALPDGLDPSVVTLLASLLHPPVMRLADIDASIVNLAALADKLAAERFDGLLRLTRRGVEGLPVTGVVLFSGGETVLTLFSEGWDGYPVDESWVRWVSNAPLTASLEEKSWSPAFLSFRRELADFELTVRPSDEPGGRLTSGLRTLQRLSRTGATGATAFHVTLGGTASPAPDETLCAHDPAYRFLCWALETLPGYFEERERANRWKYLSEWLRLVRGATLHHALPRPDARESDLFDLVTHDERGKVLHLGQRVATGNPQTLRSFLDRVIAAKSARIRTGDVGGAFLIAPAFEASTIEAYREATRPEATSKTFFGFEEKLTGYEGFVRIGPRRGFHLLLVAETAAGFEPLLL